MRTYVRVHYSAHKMNGDLYNHQAVNVNEKLSGKVAYCPSPYFKPPRFKSFNIKETSKTENNAEHWFLNSLT